MVSTTGKVIASALLMQIASLLLKLQMPGKSTDYPRAFCTNDVPKQVLMGSVNVSFKNAFDSLDCGTLLFYRKLLIMTIMRYRFCFGSIMDEIEHN